MNLNTNLAKREDAEKTCNFLNQRFGYRMALEAVLAAQGFGQTQVNQLCEMARDRRFEEFNMLLKAKT